MPGERFGPYRHTEYQSAADGTSTTTTGIDGIYADALAGRSIWTSQTASTHKKTSVRWRVFSGSTRASSRAAPTEPSSAPARHNLFRHARHARLIGLDGTCGHSTALASSILFASPLVATGSLTAISSLRRLHAGSALRSNGKTPQYEAVPCQMNCQRWQMVRVPQPARLSRHVRQVPERAA
jgi:hypothetical protein